MKLESEIIARLDVIGLIYYRYIFYRGELPGYVRFFMCLMFEESNRLTPTYNPGHFVIKIRLA
jgi:hypothetical protein